MFKLPFVSRRRFLRLMEDWKFEVDINGMLMDEIGALKLRISELEYQRDTLLEIDPTKARPK